MVQQMLNLSGLSFLRSQDLLHLAPGNPDEAACSLQELSLNSTGIDDDAATYISRCPSLETLGVAGTKLSSRFCLLGNQPEFMLRRRRTIFHCRRMSQTFHT